MHKRRITWNNSWDSVLGLLHHSTKRTDGSRADDNWFKTIATIHRKTDTKAQSDHKSNTVAVLRGETDFLQTKRTHGVQHTRLNTSSPSLTYQINTNALLWGYCTALHEWQHSYICLHAWAYIQYVLYTCIHSCIHTDMHETRMNICIKTKIRK